MIMGDGYITKSKGERNSYFSICHSLEQKPYTLHKKQVLEYLTSTRFYDDQPNGVDGAYRRCRLDTKSHPIYTALRGHLYHNGRKTVTEHALKCLTPQGLAYWYMDDGCLSNHENFDQPTLCTHGFNLVENELIAKFLAKKFGIEWRLRKDSRKWKGELKTYYSLSLRRKDREKFFELIKHFIIDSMLYKITPKTSTIAVRLGEKLKLICHECKNEFEKEFKNRNDACKYCSQDCYFKSKKHAKGTQIVTITQDGRGRDNLGQFAKLSEDIVCSA